MRKYLLFLVCIIPLILFGKETKKVTIEYLYPPYKEIFYVLKSDSTVRQGSYRLVLNGKILCDGTYKMGMKDSLWTQYNEIGKLRFRGFYSENKRIGIWQFNDEKGEPEQKIDFSNNQIIMYRSQLTGYTFRVYSGINIIYSFLDRPPLYLGGISRINDFITSEITAPLHKANEKIMGTVFVEFTIDSVGKTSGHHVLRGVGTRSTEEALRVVRLLPEEWIPGVINGRNVTTDYVIPVVFDEKLFKNQ